MKRFCGHLALSLALVLSVPAISWAIGSHYFDCKQCHKVGVSVTDLGNLSTNVCLQCHGGATSNPNGKTNPYPGYSDTTSDTVFSVNNASDAYGTNPVIAGGGNSHAWSATSNRPAAGAVEPATNLAGFYGRYQVSNGKVTCTRCHNPHGEAYYDLLINATGLPGTVDLVNNFTGAPGPDGIMDGDGIPDSLTGNKHLMIKDALNTQNANAPMSREQLCQSCHTPLLQDNYGLISHPVIADYNAILSGAEYQSGGGKEGWLQATIGNGGGAGTVKSVNEKVLSGALPAPAVTNYVNGVGCNSCHRAHGADSDSATGDGLGITVNAGDGKLLRSDGAIRSTDTPTTLGATTPAIAQLRSNLCQACHTFKTHGSTGSQMGCLDCHSGHTVGSANYFVLRNQVGATTGLSYTTRSPLHGGSTPVDDLWSGAPGDATGYCERCHGALLTMPGSARTHIENENCRTCHAHDGTTYSFEAAGGCDGCHGTPPTQNVVGGPNGYAAGYTPFKDESATPHAAHAAGGTNYTFACNACHLNNTHDMGTFQDVFVGGSYDPLASGSGNMTPAYNTANPGTCSNVYCHSNGGRRTGDSTRVFTAASINGWTAGSTTGAINDCISCHNVPSATASPAHSVHLALTGVTCKTCHVTTADSATVLAAGAIGGTHVNNVRNVAFDTSGFITVGATPYDGTTGVCSVYCHGNGITKVSPDWDAATAGDCGTCHQYSVAGVATGSGPALSSAHNKHVYASGGGVQLLCTVCHTNAGSGADHVNGSISYVSNYQQNVCNPCHGSSNGVSTGDDRQPVWTNTASVDCQTCHAGSVVATINAKVAGNKSQATGTGHNRPTASGNYTVSGNVPANKQCASCHNEANRTGHLDGTTGNATRLLALAANCTTTCHGASGSAVKDGIVTHEAKLCSVCHDPHGSGNIYMIKATSSGEYSGTVVFTATSGGDSYDEVDAVNGDDLCATCHTAGNQTQQHNNKTNTGVAHNEGSDCFTCHRSHTEPSGAFIAGGGTSCNGCHGFPPATGAHRTGTSLSDLELHSNTTLNTTAEDRTDCEACHTGAASYTYDPTVDRSGSLNHGNAAGRRTILAGTVGFTKGAGNVWNCTTACHSSSTTDGFWYTWDDVGQPTQAVALRTPVDNNGLNCNACHYYAASPTSAGNVTVNNSEALGGDHSVHFGLGGVVTCTNCHDVENGGSPVSGPLTHVITPNYALGNDDVLLEGRAIALQDNADVTAAALGSNSDPDPGNATCNNVACHNPSGTTYSAQWNVTAGSCTTCHSTTDPGTGSHDEHMAAATTFGINTITCVSCHGTNPSSNAHRNGVVNFTTTPAVMGYTGGAEDVGGTLGTCTTTTCHNNGTAAATAVPTPQWGTASADCTICHGNAPSTGEHAKHVANTTYVDGSCADCHTAANTTTHINSVRNISGQITDMDLVAGGNQLVAPGGWNGTCANACHIANTANDWTAGTLACTDCHGSGKVTTPAMDRGWPPSSGAHAKHLANTAYVTAVNCTNCHNDNSSTHSTLNNVVTTAIGTAAQRITANSGNGSCTNTCHVAAEANDWTGGSAAITCTDCHAGTYIGGGANGPVSGLHVGTAPSVTGQLHNQTVSGGCAACHPTVMAQTTTHVKGTFTGNGSVPGDRTAMGLAGFYTNGGSDNLGTCLATGCHTGRDDWSHQWMAPANYTNTTASCQGCHGSNLALAGLGNAGVTHRTVAVKHNGVTTNYNCRDCHAIEGAGYTFTFGTQDWGGGSNHGNGQVDINNTGTSYNQTSGYCETCHNLDGRNFADTGWAINPVAGTAISTACGECHYDGVTTGVSSTSHTAHGITTGDLQAGGAKCIVCHGNNSGNNFQSTLAGSHGTGTVNLDTSRITAYPGGLVKWDGSESTCTNSCHNTAGGEVWDVANGLACSSCHYYEAVVNSANNTGSTAVGGSHNAHFAAAAVTACTQCHPNNSADTAAPRTHIGGTTLLERSSEALIADNAEMTPLGAAFNDTNNTCNNTACHNPSSESYVSNAWGTPNAGCTMCHGDMTTKPTTGSHLVHLNANGNGFGISPTCTSCHPATADPAHMNSVKNVSVAKNSVTTVIASPTAAGGCGTNDCHNNGVSLTTGTPLVSTYTWGNAITDCTECHGTATTLSSNAHNEHLNNGYASPACTDCHTAANLASHINKSINLDAAKATYSRTASVAIGGTPNGTCSTASCHNRGAAGQPAQSAAWNTAGDLTCNSCHGDATAGLSTSHGDHLSAGKSCAQCHDTLPTTTAHISNKSTLIDGSVAASGEANITFVNAAAVTDYSYNSTEHSCYSPTNNGLGCHATAGSAGAADPTRPDWDVAFAATACTNCHTNTSTAAVNPTSGLHGITPSVTGQRHDSSLPGGCTVCHNTMSQFTNHKNGAFTGDTMGDLGLRYYTQTAANTGTCSTTSCHTGRDDWAHQWMAPANYNSITNACLGCHGSNVGVANFGTTGVTHRAVTKKHNAAATNYTCRDCHAIEGAGYTFTFGTQDWGGGSNHGNGQVDVNSTGTSYNQTSGYCEGCHTSGAFNFADTSWTINSVAGTAISTTCGECHTDGVQTGAESATHLAHGADRTDLVAGQGSWTACTPCHPDVNYDNAHSGTLQFANVTYSGGENGTCSTSNCHNRGAEQSNAWDSATQLECNDCHYYEATVVSNANNAAHAAPLSNRHDTHLGKAVQCAVCHTVPGAGDTAHINGTSTLADKATATFGEAAVGGSKTITYSNPNCTANFGGLGCHATAASEAWNQASGTIACTDCHTDTTTSSVNPISGLHAGPLTVSANPHDGSFQATHNEGSPSGTCVTCHTTSPSSAHTNGTLNSSSPIITITANVGFVDGTTPTCGPTAGLANCHDDGGAWKRRWSITAKNSDGTQCVNCHSGYTNPAVIGSYSGITGMSLRHDFNNDADNALYNNHGGASLGAPCYQCHGYKPGDTIYYNINTMHRNNTIELNNQNSFEDPNTDGTVRCNACHTTPYGTADEQFSFQDTYNGDADGFARWGRDLATVNGPAGGCNACHGGVDGSSNPQYWPDGAGSGYQDSSAGAHDNHILALADHLYGITTLNALRADAGTDAKQKAICAFCHPNPGEAGHNTDVNGGTYNSPTGRVDVLQSSFLTYDGNLASKVDTTSAAYNYTNLTCSNLACHNQVTTPSGANNWNTPPASPTCAICHTGAGASQRHDVHVTTKGYACTECHTNVGTYPTGTGAALRHADGEIQLVWNNAGSFENSYGGGSVTYSQAGALKYKDATWGTCASAACHNNQLAPAWNTALTSACTNCHTVGGSNTATTAHPSSGIHDVARITGKLHDDSFTYGTNYASTADCIYCHTTTPTTASGHINGVNDYSIGVNDVTGARVNLAAAVGFTDAVVPTCAPTLGTGCHVEQWAAATDHTWTRTWHESAGNNNGTECQGCHGTFTQTWRSGVSPVHTTDFDGNNGAEIRNNHDHGAGTETEYNQCISCHVYNDALYGTLGWGSGTTASGNKHGNGQIEMITAMGYNTTSNSCATNCHEQPETGSHAMTPDSGWTVVNLAGPTLVCTSCHSGTGNGAYKVGSTSTHVIRGTKAGMNTFNSCEDCHPYHTGGVLIPNYATVGINYTSGGRTGFRLGGTATTGATEAEICWNCHSNTATYQNTAISEWGANTKQTGAPAGITPYNYGTLSGTANGNWIGATWNSAVAAFGYKSSTIRSTHTANPTGAPWNGPSAAGVDTVGQIRCSYCHDVHNTASGVVTGDVAGKPFLRGTWWTNPYREDGAPLASGTTWTGYDWGAVPRGSILNNELGGFQIDQNNNYPTNNGTAPTKAGSTWTWSNSWTYSGSAGLCALCHGATVNTLNKFGTAGPNAAWIGTNGHANSAVGGTGANPANIFRTADRAPSGLTTTGARPDMGYANHGTAVGYGFRGPDGRAFRDVPAMVGIQSGNATRPYGGQFYSWGATVDAGTTEIKYHNFSCSKCHNPHASRLPRLMITNCLDTKQNTWDDGKILDVTTTNSNGITLSATTAPDSFGRTWSNVTSAQNCHRLAGTNTAQSAGFGSGWNRVTPWNISTKNPDNGTIP